MESEKEMVELQYYLSNVPEALIYGLLAMGIYISLRILDIPDLTTEGSFGFGAVISVLVSLNGHPILAVFAGMAAGMIAGLITGALQTKLNVHPVLAGIITMSGLYSINLMVRGSSNLNFNDNSAFTKFYKAVGISGADKKIAGLVIGAVICILVLILLIVFFRTHLGLCIRATGDNPDMVRASSINVDFSLIFGLALANGLIALSGALISHYLGLSDQSFSNGTLIYGLAAVIIGEAIFGKRNVALGLTSAVVGSVIYKIIVAFVIDVSLFGKNSENLMKLTCAIIVAATLIVPEIKHKIENAKAKKEARKNA